MMIRLLAAGLFALALASCSSDDRISAMRDMDTASMISLADAVEVAQERIPGGFAVEAVLEIEDDDENEPPAYEVVLYVAKEEALVEVEVHALTGAVLEVERGDDGEDE